MDCSKFTDINGRLKEFPNSFQLDIRHLVSTKRRRSVLDKLLNERKTGKMGFMEENRNDNFASFLFFLLKSYDESLDKNTEVIDRDPQNIIARANRVLFLCRNNLTAADERMKELEAMKKGSFYKRQQAVAEAELAFCLASISPPCYFKAVEKYRSVNEKYPSEYLWRFGEALTIRRGITFNSTSREFLSDIITYTVRCNELLLDVAEHAEDPLRGRAWVQLGELSNSLKKTYPPFTAELAKIAQKKTRILSPIYCFKSALKLSGNDTFVLERCGRFYRYFGELNESKVLLEKAISRRPTSYSLQHLALTLIKISERNAAKHGPVEQRRVIAECVEPTSSTSSAASVNHNIRMWLQTQDNRFNFSCEDPLAETAIKHLEEAAKLSNWCNTSAINDLAFSYLRLETYTKAEEMFRKIISSNEIRGSPVFTIYAYEQTGLCCLRKSEEREISQEEKDALVKEGICYLTYAVETAARLASEIPSLACSEYQNRKAFRTVTDLLQKQYDTYKNTNVLKEMAHLYELVGKYKESLDIYQKLCVNHPTDADETQISIRLINNYLKVKDYDNANLYLSLLLCTEQASDVSDELVNRVYLETARHVLEQRQTPPLAHHSFKRAFERRYGSRNDNDADGFDVMILHDEDNVDTKEVSQTIQTILETYTGLAVTRNLEAAFGGHTVIHSYELLISSTRVLIIVLCRDPPSRERQFFIDLALTIWKKRQDMSIICLTTGSDNPVTSLKQFKTGKTPVGEDLTWLFEVFELVVNP